MSQKTHSEAQTNFEKKKLEQIRIIEEAEKEIEVLQQRLASFKEKIQALQTEEDAQAFVENTDTPDEGMKHILLFI